MIHNSIREGFALVVSEAFWKEKPVVAGKVSGIPMKFPEEFYQYLVQNNEEECAEKTLHLLRQPGARGAFGLAAREHVRKHFLTPRLVRDELELIKEFVT